MAYNNSGDTKTVSAHWVERTNSRGENSKYFSFTVPIGNMNYTFRVYANSTYTPNSGKNQGKLSCPVRVTRWQKSAPTNNKW